MIRPLTLPVLALATIAQAPPGIAQAARPLAPEDYYRFAQLTGLQLAPDGQSAAYLVTGNACDSGVPSSVLWPVSGAGGEPLSQALRALGVSAQRVVNRGEHHSFKRPSLFVDRWQRQLDGLGRYLQ